MKFIVEPNCWEETERRDWYIDPSLGPLIWLRYFPNGRSSKILFQSHHCATDAIGAFQFFKDWFAIYRSLIVDRNAIDLNARPRLTRLEPESLRDRTKVKLSIKQRLQLLTRQWHSIKGVFKFQKRLIRPLVVCESANSQ